MVRGDQVVVVPMRQRPDHGVFAGPCGQARQMLAHLKPRHGGRDRSELPANLRGCLRLQIEGVVVAGTTREEDNDDRLRPVPSPRRLSGRTESTLPQQRGQGDPKQSGEADLQQFPAGDADGMGMVGAEG